MIPSQLSRRHLVIAYVANFYLYPYRHFKLATMRNCHGDDCIFNEYTCRFLILFRQYSAMRLLSFKVFSWCDLKRTIIYRDEIIVEAVGDAKEASVVYIPRVRSDDELHVKFVFCWRKPFSLWRTCLYVCITPHWNLSYTLYWQQIVEQRTVISCFMLVLRWCHTKRLTSSKNSRRAKSWDGVGDKETINSWMLM